MPDYQKAIIYCIKSINDDENNGDIYYGATTQGLNVRWSKHKTGYKNNKIYKCKSSVIFDKYGIENCKCELIESYPCNNIKELNEREKYYIQNNNCVNIMGSNTQEMLNTKNKEYKEKNKEYIAEQNKIYREKNKEIISEKGKIYREINKEKRIEYVNKNKDELYERKKQYYEINKEKIKEKTKEYYENNKDKRHEYLVKNKKIIAEQMKKYKEEHKEELKEKRKQYKEKSKNIEK